MVSERADVAINNWLAMFSVSTPSVLENLKPAVAASYVCAGSNASGSDTTDIGRTSGKRHVVISCEYRTSVTDRHNGTGKWRNHYAAHMFTVDVWSRYD
jgi:hypothetical protein